MPEAGARSREFAAIAGILLLAAGLRGVILFSGHRGLRSDEAVVGLMAKHIFTRGETPLFLYGQPYGGGHALVAYLAAPLFALFGRSATLLTGISVSLSLVNIWLVWCITRRCFGALAADCAAALYAFSPPVVYQSFLVNGGTEAFLLALVALRFFLRSYASGELAPRRQFLAGLFAGLAYWAMDYTLLYPVVFALLWLACGSSGRWRVLARFTGGFVIGCLPVLCYNVQNDFAHFQHMFEPLPGAHPGFLAHFFGAMWGVVSGDLAAFFGGDIDDFHPAGAAAWFHAAVAVLATAVLAYQNRAALLRFLKSRPFLVRSAAELPVSLLPAIFVIVYLVMYGAAKFSLPPLRTPRYLLPLCPFLSIATAAVAAAWGGKKRLAGLTVISLLVLLGAAASLRIGLRPWHEEHRIRTCGSEIAQLAKAARQDGVKLAFAPYEIQWRLMFETDETVLVSSLGISPAPSKVAPSRYPAYDAEVLRRIGNGEEFAFIFRRDFKFAEWAAKGHRGSITRDIWVETCQREGISPQGIPASNGPEDNFVIFFPLKGSFLQALKDTIGAETRKGAGLEGPRAPSSGVRRSISAPWASCRAPAAWAHASAALQEQSSDPRLPSAG